MLSLPAPLEPARVAAKAEPYPCRRMTRFVIGGPSDLDEEMLGWIAQAYWFAHS